MVHRVYVQKREGFDVEATNLCSELRSLFNLTSLKAVRVINRYDVEGVSDELFERCIPLVFSEPQTDVAGASLAELGVDESAGAEFQRLFAVEALPGQYDQRADSAAQCIQFISQGARSQVACAKLYVLEGEVSDAQLSAVKSYVINPVEAREASSELPETLCMQYAEPAPVPTVEGFIDFDEAGIERFISEYGLAMDAADVRVCQEYFSGVKRNPTLTEIKVIDTYWSDHCRHTTFNTVLEDVRIENADAQRTYERYQEIRRELGREEKPVSLMDLGTIGARYLKSTGQLTGLDESEEINACTVKIDCDVNGETEPWLYLFKNETHNHPTEIEPFGGAATCVGGAIRDPLSGRSYVYQAMRVTGASDPRVPLSDTMAGKLPQRRIVTEAARGYSSYGNQIGLATGQVNELYHPGYAAKRMEIGAVVGATPASHVRRETPVAGDVVVLVGGRTGRDGIGGATGSSKAHKQESLETCGAEVQKGNAPEERKLQRLFRRKDACVLIKRCNDFGAGGVSVATCEIADGLSINLDAVLKKYEGLDGTELAISESQERMAVAIAADDLEKFLALAHEENLEAVPVATVTDDDQVVMTFRGQEVVHIGRELLASNGAPKYAQAVVSAPLEYRTASQWSGSTFAEKMESLVSDINVCSNKGLSERFDSTIGAASVLMPFGGETQLTPAQAMVAKLPVFGETTTVSGLSWGFNPYLSSANQYEGAYTAVLESVSRLVATGFDYKKAYLTFQEYFERLRNEPTRWGTPLGSLLGALQAQLDMGVGSIGGKDSMSGSFEELDVPPTLVSFATAVGSVDTVISPEFKGAGHRVVLIGLRKEDELCPKTPAITRVFDKVAELISSGAALAVSTPGYGGVAEALFKMCVGNGIGLDMSACAECDRLFNSAYGTFVVELAEGAELPSFDGEEGAASAAAPVFFVGLLGETTEAYKLVIESECIDLAQLQDTWEGALEEVFPYRHEGERVEAPSFEEKPPLTFGGILKTPKPQVLIPVFPGTNCEYDSAAAFEAAGAQVHMQLIRNITSDDVATSVKELAEQIAKAHIIMLPGGFSGGDEPDGSAKFITSFFRSPEITEAVRELLGVRDGLMLGICNGFQALVKLGLVPFGDIVDATQDSPTLTFNTIGRHQSKLVYTRQASSLSPWFAHSRVGDVFRIPISHGEGRFVANDEVLARMMAQGQIASQYCSKEGVPSMDWDINPNGSVMAIEGITSPDGRVLGKMGHSERSGAGLYKNVPGNTYQPLFAAGVDYFVS